MLCAFASESALAAPPTASAGTDQDVAESAPVSLDGTASFDSDGTISSFAWSQTAGTAVSLSGAGTATPSFTAPSLPDGSPPEVLTFQLLVTDNDGETDTDSVNVTVTANNGAPTANNDSPLPVDEDSTNNSLNVTANDTDPDGDNLTVTAASASVGAATPSGGNVLYTPPTNFFGNVTINYTISDGNGGTDSAVVSLTVSNVNDAPTAANDNANTPENTAVTTNVRANDTDIDTGDTLSVTLQNNVPTANGTVSCTANNCTYTPDLDFNGNDSYSYEVCDNGAPQLCDSATVAIDITAVNDVPSITGQEPLPLTTLEDNALEILLTHLTVVDPDNTFPADFTLSVRNGANYTRNGNVITPSSNFNGQLTVPVTVNDGEDDSLVFNVAVTVDPVNDAPVITGQQPLGTLEDTSLTILITDLIVVDPDSNFPADFTLLLQDGADYTRSGNTITPAQNFDGLLDVRATASDGFANSAVFLLRVDITAENDAPILLTPIGGQDAVENSPFNLSIAANFSDPDNANLTYTAEGLPISGNIAFNQNTGVFSGTPVETDTQDFSYQVTVTASDGLLSATDTFNLTVSALDRANVSLAVVTNPQPAILSDEVQFGFTVRNNGPTAATGIELNGSFVGDGLTVTPSGATFCTLRAPVGQVTDFSCQIGDLLVNASTNLTIAALTSNPGSVTLSATAAVVAPVPIDPNVQDNSIQTSVGVAETLSNGAVQVLGDAQILSVAVGDVNGDGAVDLVLGTVAGLAVQIHVNSGFRDFNAAPITVADNSATQGIALADFDGNGTLDMVLANAGTPDTVYANDGSANFTLLATLPGDTLSNDVGVGDFDGDNAMDIVFAVTGGNPVYRGNGSGGFTLDGTLGSADSRAVAVGRINNDNGPDAVFANVGSDSTLWTRVIGTGANPSRTFTIGDASSVVIAELFGSSNDNALDLAFGRVPSVLGDIAGNPVLTNNGSGAFTLARTLGIAPTNDILAGDVNRDGQNDLVFINENGVHQIWNRTGDDFALHSEQIVAESAQSGVIAELGMTDVGEPGGVDLAAGGTPMPGAGVYLNDGFGNLGRGDAVAPELTLNGTDPMEVPSGSVFTDPKATAVDNIDGDISTSVIATGTVNTALVGSYTVTYNVTDFAGNPATPISRTVTVTPSAGTGGGGGGALSYWILLFLLGSYIISYNSRAWIAQCCAVRTEPQGITE